jgi:hypothetical protein
MWWGCSATLLVAGMLAFAFAAVAQTAPDANPGPSTPPPSAQAPEPSPTRDLVDTVGRWFQDGREKLDSHMKGAREALGEFHNKARDNAKQAAGALVPPSRIVDGNARCAVAPNGAPDCAEAANSVCAGKGFKAGQSVATQAQEKCPARVLLSGRSPAAGECKVETFVTRAVCQ